MSKYTTELRWLIEQGYDIGLKNYPIFDEAYRAALNAKIIEHYYFREICCETAALFKRFINRKMNEIMPYYNQMYKSQLLQIEPLLTEKFTETYTKDNTANVTNNSDTVVSSTANTTDKNIFSETPQGLLSMASIETNLYATTASLDDNKVVGSTSTLGEGTGNSTASENFTKNNSGFSGNQSDMLMKYRETFLNIDMLVIEELEDCFFQLY